jgi:hypothetical protein
LTGRERECQSDEVVLSIHEQRQLNEAVERLTRRYPEVRPETVSEVVNELHSRFAGARVRDFVPLFVERRANAALEELSVSYDSLLSADHQRHAPVA